MDSRVNMAVQERVSFPIKSFHLEWTIEKLAVLKQSDATLYSSGITMAELGIQNLEGRWRIAVGPSQEVKLCLTDTAVESTSYTGRMAFHVLLKLRLVMGERTASPIMEYIDYFDKNTFIVSSTTNQTRSDYRDARYFRSGSYDSYHDYTRSFQKAGIVTILMDVEIGFPESVRTLGTGEKIFAACQLDWLTSGVKFTETDFLLRSMDGKEFHTHRNLLITHSPTFAAILSEDLDAKHCELSDVDGESIELMLSYLYACETEDINDKNAEKVFIMADKFQLIGLRAICEQTLIKYVTVERAPRYLLLAWQRDLMGLQEAALCLIPKRIGALLSDTASMEMLKLHPHVGKMIMERCVKNVRGLAGP